MKTTTTATINLTVADLEKIIAKHFGAAPDSPRPAIYFKVSDISDDRFGGSHYRLVGCDVTLQIDMETGLLNTIR